jgi:vanillate O-demethylase ferredoxin subunit
LHDEVRVGHVLTVGAPRNAFALRAGASHSILLAGGIGITPLKAMAHVLAAQGRSFELHYCARSERHAAFVDELAALLPPGRLHLHFDGGDPARGLDIRALLARPSADRHLYYCGPRRFMECCAEASAHWPKGTVHSEHFKAPERQRLGFPPETGFEVKLARAGVVIRVAPEQSIAHALERAGHAVPTSCLSGLCGSCKVDYLEGDVDHRDCVLSDKEKTRSLTTCVSRAKSASLVLDL